MLFRPSTEKGQYESSWSENSIWEGCKFLSIWRLHVASYLLPLHMWSSVNCQVPELYFFLAKTEDVKRKGRTSILEHPICLKARNSTGHSWTHSWNLEVTVVIRTLDNDSIDNMMRKWTEGEIVGSAETLVGNLTNFKYICSTMAYSVDNICSIKPFGGSLVSTLILPLQSSLHMH